MTNEENKLLNIRIPIDVHNKLLKQMEIEERTKTIIVKNALLKYFEAYETQEK